MNPGELLAAEHQVEERSAELKKELSLTDLVFTQVLYITASLSFLGTAGKLGSIVFVGAMILMFAMLSNLGVGSQEAYQLLDNAWGVCYGLTYLVMFAIPLAARGEKPSWGVRAAALSGFCMTLLYVVLSVFPIIDVKNSAIFAAKVSAVVLGSNLLGAAFFWNARRRRLHERATLTRF